MIDENKTLELFGYTSDSLSYGSYKRVVAICDGCGKERILKFQKSKKLCKSCAGKNKFFSKETKEKMSKSRIGIIFSDEHKQNISKSLRGKYTKKFHPNYGKKHTEESKQKMSESHIGKKLSKKTKKKISKANSDRFGDKNPNWNGGSSFKKYCSKFNETIKEQIRKEFNRKCILCGIPENNCNRKLSVHHVDYDRTQGCNSDWWLVPLCSRCHSKTSGKYLRDYYEELISRLLYVRKLIFEYENKIDYKSM